MFYQVASLSVFISILLHGVHYCDTVNSDYVLSYSNPNSNKLSAIKIQQKSTRGDGISFCSWIQLTEPETSFFIARDAEPPRFYFLRSIISFSDKFITVDTDHGGVQVTDPNLIDYTSWFHVCTVMQLPTFKFYFNGTPVEDYTVRGNTPLKKINNLEVEIGDIESYGGNGSFFLTNVFDRALTAGEVKNLYDCKDIEGDIVSWKDITSKSKEIIFNKNINLMKATVPCPRDDQLDRPKGDPLQSLNGAGGDPGSSSGYPSSSSADPGSSSGDPGSSSGDPGSSSGDSYPGSSSRNLDQFTN